MAKPQGIYIEESSKSCYRPEHFRIPNFYANDLASILVPHGLVLERTSKMADEIHADIGNEPLVVLCVLKGSYRFFTDLVDKLGRRRARGDHALVPDFVRVRSYANQSSTGTVDIIGWEHLVKLTGQNVLIVEDLIDTGLTMEKLVARLNTEHPKSIRVATMAVKRVAGNHGGYKPEYVGFSLPNEFVVGYGLDYNQKLRDLDHIAVLNKQAVQKYHE